MSKNEAYGIDPSLAYSCGVLASFGDACLALVLHA